MPYIHIETTADLVENGQIPDILEHMIAATLRLPGMADKSIKAYHSLVPVWAMSKGKPFGFARITVSILTGRSVEERKHLSDELYAVARECFNESFADREHGAPGIELTLEIREIDAATYSRGCSE